MRNDLVSVGYISRAHGTAGEVELKPTLNHPEIFSENQIYFLQDGRQSVPVRAENLKLVRKGDQFSFFVKFENVTNRNEAEKLKGLTVLLPEDIIPQSDLYSDDDLIGYTVISQDNVTIGEVVDVIENPGHSLIQIKDSEGEFFVPFVDAYILEIDDENGKIITSDLSALKAISQ